MSALQIRILGIIFFLASFVCLMPRAPRANASFPVPEHGTFSNGVYANAYFGMRYTVPAGMQSDVQGPEPSVNAYYLLASFISKSENLNGSLLLAAQDNFFSADASGNAIDFVKQMRVRLDPSLSVPEAPSTEQIAGRTFARLNYNGAGLYHAIFVVEIRCHTLLFSFTSANPRWLQSATDSLNALALTSTQDPVCIRNYATPSTVMHRVQPQTTGPRYAGVPVRLVIGPDGNVQQVHAIAGFPEQMQNVSAAIAQWKFKPYELDGKPVAVETGLLFRFTAGGGQ